MAHFADRLIARLRQLGHPLCLGLDPHLGSIPPLFRRGTMEPRSPETAIAVQDFLYAVLDRYADHVAIVKPQSAFYERLGWRGMQVLENVVARAHARGLLVLLDAKRGDIDSTAEAYAQAYLHPDGGIPVDAMTVNPYLGRDTLAAFIRAAQELEKGLFVLVKTSNPGARDYQDQRIAAQRLCEVVAASLRDTVEQLRGPETHWSACGVVVGATQPDDAARIREILPGALFLVPGYGAQGGGAAAAVSGFVRGSAGTLEGGIVNSSRGAIFPEAAYTDETRAWERAIDGARDRAIEDLTRAIA